MRTHHRFLYDSKVVIAALLVIATLLAVLSVELDMWHGAQPGSEAMLDSD